MITRVWKARSAKYRVSPTDGSHALGKRWNLSLRPTQAPLEKRTRDTEKETHIDTAVGRCAPELPVSVAHHEQRPSPKRFVSWGKDVYFHIKPTTPKRNAERCGNSAKALERRVQKKRISLSLCGPPPLEFKRLSAPLDYRLLAEWR